MPTNNSINGSCKITTYTGSTTWNKDARAQYITVILFSGGISTVASSGKGGDGARGQVTVIEFF